MTYLMARSKNGLAKRPSDLWSRPDPEDTLVAAAKKMANAQAQDEFLKARGKQRVIRKEEE